MKTSVSALLLAAALGAVAHPSGHGHRHFHRSPTTYKTSVQPNNNIHDKTVEKVQIPPSPKEDGLLAPASPAAEPIAPLAPLLNHAPHKEESSSSSSSHGSSNSGVGPDSYEPFCGGANLTPGSYKPQCPAAKWKRATVAQVAEAGNLGSPGNYGCNLKLVKKDYAMKYDYTFRFNNNGNHKQVCKCWLKVGPDGCGINGFWKGNEVLTFSVAAQCDQYLAIQANSKGGCSCYKDEVPVTPNYMLPNGIMGGGGQYASTWLEFDMGSHSNGGSTGADASCLVAAKAKMDIPGMRVCREDDEAKSTDTCSIIYPGGEGNKLAYPANTENEDGRSVNVGAGPTHYLVDIDYQGKS